MSSEWRFECRQVSLGSIPRSDLSPSVEIRGKSLRNVPAKHETRGKISTRPSGTDPPSWKPNDSLMQMLDTIHEALIAIVTTKWYVSFFGIPEIPLVGVLYISPKSLN